MPEFLYRVRNNEGRVFAGVLEAEDSKQLRHQLHHAGYYVVSLRKYGAGWKFIFGRKEADIDSTIMFTRHLASMLEVGMDIMSALESIWKGMEKEKMQIIVSRVRTRLSAGQSLSRAIEMTEAFPVFYCSLLSVAESGGGFVYILKKLLAYLEHQREFQAKIKKASLYPSFVLAFAALVLILMMVTVVPTFQKVFTKIKAPMPPVTQFTINVSQAMRSFWFWGILIGIVAVITGAYSLLRKNPKFEKFFDRTKLRLPILGKIIYLAAIERFVRTLGLLVSSGVTLVTSLDVTRTTLDNKELETALGTLRGKIIRGEPLSVSFMEGGIFPAFLIEMVRLGEQTGTLGQVLERSADYFYEELDTRMNNFLTLLEPALIVLVGAVVVFVLWSTYVPIFSLWDKIPQLR